jgi:hypothetical protein
VDWLFADIDAYCERSGPEVWAEPVNAITNIAFIFAGAIMWHRTRGLREGRALSVILVVIGLASGLFHTIEQGWTAALDSLAIFIFALFYIYLANRDFWRLSAPVSAIGSAVYIPFTIALTPLFASLPGLAVSAFYWPLVVLIAAYGLLLRARHPHLARGLLIGAGLLGVSITLRSLDETLCNSLPLGTHFLWHLLNAVMLAHMIEVWRAHVVLEGRAPAR